jgi:heptosyltransferase-2
MAQPALADVRRALPRARLVVAARREIAALFAMVAEVDDVVIVERGLRRDIGAELAGRGFEAALLLPNSMHAALVAKRAGIPERWGYRTDWRGALLTRAVDPPSGLHQVEYYQQLVHALEFPNGPMEPRVVVPPGARAAAQARRAARGWNGTTPLVAIAPGAAFGGAKRWPPASFAELARALAGDGVRTVVVGTAADRSTADDVLRAFGQTDSSSAASPAALSPIDLVGRTDLVTLAGVFTLCRALETNDSGAMHLAAAAGTRVTAVFGATDERATRPMGDAHGVVTGPAWCRPCLLRECPLDHRCMRGIEVGPVLTATRSAL